MILVCRWSLGVKLASCDSIRARWGWPEGARRAKRRRSQARTSLYRAPTDKCTGGRGHGAHNSAPLSSTRPVIRYFIELIGHDVLVHVRERLEPKGIVHTAVRPDVDEHRWSVRDVAGTAALPRQGSPPDGPQTAHAPRLYGLQTMLSTVTERHQTAQDREHVVIYGISLDHVRREQLLLSHGVSVLLA